MTPDAIRARLDAYAAEDPADGDYGDFQRDYAAPELFAAVRAVLHRHQPVSVHGGLFDVCAACCCDRSGQMTSECVTYHHHAKGLAHCHDVKAIAAALGVAEPAQPTKRECDHDLCEDGACTKYGQPPVSAQAEPRVWRDGDAEPEDHPDVTDRYGNAWTWRLGLWFRTNQSVGPTWWSLVRRVGPLTEVTDQAGEAR